MSADVTQETRTERLLKLAKGLDGMPTVREAQRLEGLPVSERNGTTFEGELAHGPALFMCSIVMRYAQRDTGCGTVGCLAGHGVGILGLPYSGDSMGDVRRALGLDQDASSMLFVPEPVPIVDWVDIDGSGCARVLRDLAAVSRRKEAITRPDVKAAWATERQRMLARREARA